MVLSLLLTSAALAMPANDGRFVIVPVPQETASPLTLSLEPSQWHSFAAATVSVDPAKFTEIAALSRAHRAGRVGARRAAWCRPPSRLDVARSDCDHQRKSIRCCAREPRWQHHRDAARRAAVDGACWRGRWRSRFDGDPCARRHGHNGLRSQRQRHVFDFERTAEE